MKNFELIRKVETALGGENADFEARQIVYYALGVDSTGFMKIRSDEASEKTIFQCEEMTSRRKNGEPLYYILGKAEFYGLPFFVGEGVLIPRDDTEILVDTALEKIKDIKNPRVLDLCSGSGAIAVAIAKNRPDACVTAVEKYDEAFSYLEKNIALNDVKNVILKKQDALEFFGEYDLVVSNPPYISERERSSLAKEVLCEPQTALFADNDGFMFYEKISENFKLNKNFNILFEIGFSMAKRVSEILKSNGYCDVEVIKDYGKNDRVVAAKK